MKQCSACGKGQGGSPQLGNVKTSYTDACGNAPAPTPQLPRGLVLSVWLLSPFPPHCLFLSNNHSYTLPGLVDAGEDVETSALRELKEETGYIGHVVGTTGRQYLSPGLTPECIVTVFVEVR